MRTFAKLHRPRHAGSRSMVRIAMVVVWSITFWMALWGSVTVANAIWGGGVFGVVSLWLMPLQRERHSTRLRLLALLRLAFLFLWSLIKASALVAWEIVTPDSQINQAIVAIPLHTAAPGLITVVANAVSLTPGTLTLEVRHRPPTLYVHVLHLRAIEDVRADTHRLEAAVLAAFQGGELLPSSAQFGN